MASIPKSGRIVIAAAPLAASSRAAGNVAWRAGHGLAGRVDDTERWRDEEILRLQSLLNRRTISPAGGSADDRGFEPLIAQLESGSVGSDALHRIVGALAGNDDLVQALAKMESAGILASLIERSLQHQGLEALRQAVDNPASTEHDLRELLVGESWIFGGRYLGHVHRAFPMLTPLSLPVFRADGALRVITLNAANIPGLVVRDGDQFAVGREVDLSLNQAMRQLRDLDEQRPAILRQLKVEVRRAFATVVIGHPKYIVNDVDSAAAQDTLRTFNSHLARIEVITYEDLIQGANLALSFDEPRE